MPDFSPWGAAAQSGMGGYQYPQPIQQPVSGVASGPPPQMNGGMQMPSAWGNLNPSQMQTANMPGIIGPPMQPNGGMSAPGINGGRFNPMGQPTGIGQGGMNPLMGFLLPFLMQRMGVGGAQGGVFNRPQMNGQLGSVGAPQQMGAPNMGGGMPPQRILQGGPPAPPMQTKSPFDMQGEKPAPSYLNMPYHSIGPDFPIQGGPVGGMPPGMGAPPALPPGSTNNFNPVTGMYTNTPSLNMPAPQPQRIMQGEAGPGKTPPAPPAAPPMSPEAQMQQQAQQMELNRSLSNMAINNPMGAQMAALLRQQLMGQLGY